MVWEGGGRGVQEWKLMYTRGRFMLKFDRKQQNSVKQLSFNKKQILKINFQNTILLHNYDCKTNVCKTAKETQMYRTLFWTLRERERVG